LSVFGADIATDYAVVGTFMSAAGIGGRDGALQQLLNPVRTFEESVAKCRVARAGMAAETGTGL